MRNLLNFLKRSDKSMIFLSIYREWPAVDISAYIMHAPCANAAPMTS